MRKRDFRRPITIAVLFIMLLLIAACGATGSDTGPSGSGLNRADKLDAMEQIGGQTSDPPSVEPPQVPAPAPDSAPQSAPSDSAFTFPYQFSAVDLYGNAVNETSLGEKEVFFVHLWGTWCPPCIAEMPDLGELVREYGDRVGFLGLLTDYESNLSAAIDIVQSSGVPDSFLMIDAFEPSVSGLNDMLQSGYVPTTVLISADGPIEQIVGALGMAYAAKIDNLLD